MPTSPPSISALPTPPSTSSPTNFDSQADAFLGALPDLASDIGAVASNVYANAVEAASSASTASTAATTASTAATTALNAPATQATSSTSLTIGGGAISLTLSQSGKAFSVGQWVTVADTAAPSTRWFSGAISAFNSGSGAMTVDVAYTAGSGSATSWAVVPSSPLGVIGRFYSDVTAPSLNGGQLAGLRNRIINGGMSVSQRGTSGTTTSGGYTTDRWLVATTGTALAWVQAQTSSSLVGDYAFRALSWTGAAGNTGILLLQRIEAINSHDLAGQTVTASFWMYQTTGSTQSVLPALVYSGGAADSWGSQTGIAALDAATSVPSGVWTKVTNRFAVPTAAITGLALYPWATSITFGSGSVGYISKVQLESGSVATPFEQRSYGLELSLCRRYRRRYSSAQNTADLAYEMRATPTQTGAGPYDYDAEL